MGRYLDIARDTRRELLNDESQHRECLADPIGPCSVCGSAQWWQRPGKAWRCRQCAPMNDDDNRRATTLTLIGA